MTHQDRKKLIARYRQGFQAVTDALKGITPEEMDFKIAADKWSCREVVHHLADAESIAGQRLRRILVESSPYIQGYDQDEFAKKLKYAKRPIEPALAMLKSSQETTCELLDLMTDEDWKRSGEHSDMGPYSAERWLEVYATHTHNHAGQIQRNRAAYRR